MHKRYVIEISIREIDEEGDDVREYNGVTLDHATTDVDALEGVLTTLFSAGTEAMRLQVSEITQSERRPPLPDFDDLPNLIRFPWEQP